MSAHSAPLTIEDLIFHGNQDPAHRAIETPGKQPLTYDGLRKQVLYTVKTLNSLGFGRNDRISVIMPGGPETAVLGIGIMAGFTHAPLNPQYREDEFRTMLSRLGIKAVITEKNRETSARAAAAVLNIPVIEIIPSPLIAGLFEIAGAPVDADNEAQFAGPEDTVIVMQTSGTTSVPKIVPLIQKQFCKCAYLYCAQLGHSEADTSLHIVAHFHILGITHTLLSPLLGGGTVVCARDYISADFLPLLKTYRPTFYCAAPAHHKGILNELKMLPENELAGHSLRFIRSTSSPLPGPTRRDLETRFGVPVIESYAMTESPVIAISMPFREGSAGLPMVESLVIMDDAGTILKTPENGEVAIKGDVVFRGYEDSCHNVPAFTNGYLRTGDIGYLDSDGYLFLTGRKKELINKGGEKFSPQEIDAVLLAYPGIAEAMAFRIDDPVLGEDAAAMVVSGKKDITEADLRRYLLDRMIPFKVPKRIYFVDELPKGPTGKLLRYVGTERYNSGSFADVPAPRAAPPGPLSPAEERIHGIWKTVLPVTSLSTDDDFFQCGGNSLSAIDLLIRIQREFSVTLSPDAIYQNPTIRGQAAIVAGREKKNMYHPLIVPIHENGTLPPLFCFHPLGGWIGEYQYMSLFLSPDRPVFGIRSRGLDPSEEVALTVQDAIREYADAIKSVQPKGPYHLLGFSAGGIYAFEMARYLKEHGEDVATLGIIDMSLPSPLKSLFDLTRGAAKNPVMKIGFSVYGKINRWLKQNPDSWSYKNFVKLGIFMSQLLAVLRPPQALGDAADDKEEECIADADRGWLESMPEQQKSLVFKQISAVSLYKPTSYSGDINFFSTGPDVEFYLDDPTRGWKTVVRGTTNVIPIPGQHHTLHKEPFGQVTGQKIEESLEHAERSG